MGPERFSKQIAVDAIAVCFQNIRRFRITARRRHFLELVAKRAENHQPLPQRIRAILQQPDDKGPNRPKVYVGFIRSLVGGVQDGQVHETSVMYRPFLFVELHGIWIQ